MNRITLSAFFFFGPIAFADTFSASPGDDLEALIATLNPGDVLELNAGTYVYDSRFNISVVGTQQNPVIIRAAGGQKPIIEMATSSHNVLEIQASQYLTVSGITFTGGSHGIRLMESDFVTIENCEIYETGDVALSANSGGTYEGLVVRGNHIHHTNGTGEGMYLGCNNDACRILNSVIEGNYIHHTNRATVEQGDGIEIKEGSAGNIIRNNVIHDTKYPGILTYSTAGNGPANLIEGNVIWNTNDYSIQSAADSIIRNNIVLGSSIALQAHQSGSPSNQQVIYNTIITEDDGIAIRDVSGSVLVANNAIYSQSGYAIRLVSGSLQLVSVAGNVGKGGLQGASGGFQEGAGIGADFVNAHYNGTPPIDLYPAAGRSLIGAADSAYSVAVDFNGTPRGTSADVGAYRYQADGNPGWVVQAGFKMTADRIRPLPPQDLEAQ